MEYVTFLGPFGATFSHEAYNWFAKHKYVPPANLENVLLAKNNNEIVSLAQQHRGYAVIAMETSANARIDESLESFIRLLDLYQNNLDCPIHVLSAVKMRINFCLITKPETKDITGIYAHAMAIKACEKNIASMDIKAESVCSNGVAVQFVAESNEGGIAALGPRVAAEKYGLRIFNDAFEDSEAVTTFFLLGSASQPIQTAECNRALIVFTLPHKVGALVDALEPFKTYGLSLMQIHSAHAGNGTYNFGIEVDVPMELLDIFSSAITLFTEKVSTYIQFGPFAVFEA